MKEILLSAIEKFKGKSSLVREVIEQVKVAAPTDVSVILQGESGTGKDLLARMVHEIGPRREMPFIVLDCGTLPETLAESEFFGYEKGAFTGADRTKEGQFELADRGTLFLDEITNLSFSVQAKLLRFIQERRLRRLGGKKDIVVDVRIIAATNLDFAEEVRLKKFRADLYHRLNEFSITVPPLRKRSGDIPILANHFLEEANLRFGKVVAGFSDEAALSLVNYDWHGNVRELKNCVRRAALLAGSGLVRPEHLPEEILKNLRPLNKGGSFHEIKRSASRDVEREIIKDILAQTRFNKTQAARLLKITRTTLYTRMKVLGMK